MTNVQRISLVVGALTAAALGYTATTYSTLGEGIEAESAAAGLTCSDWRKALGKYGQKNRRFFIGAQSANIPEAVDGKPIGACDAPSKTCTITVPQCEGLEYSYKFQVSDPVNGWRLATAQAHPQIVEAWQALAASSGDFVFWSGWKELQAACLAHLTAAQCVGLVQSINDCWERPDGTTCRGPDGDVCTPVAGWKPRPCGGSDFPVYMGHEDEWQQDFEPEGAGG